MKPQSLSIFAALFTSALGAAPEHSLTREFWNSPAFVRSFMGDYGFRADVEPKVSKTEQTLLREVSARAANELPAAIEHLAAKIQPDSSPALDFALATLRFQNGQLAAARTGYGTAVKKFPTFLRAHKNLGFVLVQQDDFDDASEHLAKALSLGEGDGVTYVALGYCHLMLERHVSAENAYRAALLRSPDSSDARNGLINCLLETERHKEALSFLDEILERNPDDVFSRRARANALIALDRPKQAAATLETLRRLNALDARGLLLLGDLYHNLAVHHLSLDVYQEALQRSGDLAPQRFIRVAAILMDRAAYQAAFDYLARIERKFAAAGLPEEDHLRLLLLKADVHLATGREAEAASILARALETDPLNGKALLLLARHAWKQGDHTLAAIRFQRAAKVTETEVDALLGHARMKVQLRQYAEAADLLEQAQSIRPGDNVARYLDSVRNALLATRSKQ